MRRSTSSWLALPIVMMVAGLMSAASAWISHDLASRNTTIYSSVSPKLHRFEPTVVGITDLSNENDDLMDDDDSLSLADSRDPLRPTTIIGGWALPWGFYHGQPKTADHFPVGAWPKEPWIRADWRGLPWGEGSSERLTAAGSVDLSTPSVNAPILSSDLIPPTRGGIHVDHFTVSAVVPLPEPTVGLTMVGIVWLAMRRK